ncbi:hypothetical protein MAH1_36710 [Sessilibacter sp. MAH1]
MTTLSALGSFLGGAAGLVAALAAYRGIDAWRSQIKYGKYISVIWSCEEKLREFQLDLMDFQVQVAIQRCSSNKDLNEVKKHAEELNAKLPVLEKNFSYIDSVVEKNGHQWSNYISVDASLKLNEYIAKCLCRNRAPDLEIAELGEELSNILEWLHRLLDGLEKKYTKI